MKFLIQISNPRTVPCKSKRFEDLSDAIQEIYPMYTEDSYIQWNHIPISLDYKYDISIIIIDILEMIKTLLASEQGSYEVTFGSNTFCADWKLKWDGGEIQIESDWAGVSGNIEKILNERSKLNINKKQFLAEWKMLLQRLITDLDNPEVSFEDSHEWELLKELESSITDSGVLYSEK